MNYRKQIILIKILFVCFCSHQLMVGQIIKIGIGGAVQMHLKTKNNENQNVPDQFRQNIEYPSIALFYNDATPVSVVVNAEKELSSNEKIILSITYERSSLQNSFKGSENILGQSLEIQTYAIIGGYGHSISENNKSFASGLVGVAIKNYEGKSSLYDIQLIHHYKNTISLRFNGYLEFEKILDSPISISVGATFDYGKVDRGEVDYYQNGIKVARAVPDGDISIYDNIFALQMSIKYSFEIKLW